jgi:hypothetical protein
MKSAHLFGKAVDAAGSALAAGAFAVMNQSKKPVKKGPPKFPPSIQLAIEDLNVALQMVVKDSVCDLVFMLRHEGHCIEIITGAINQAEKDMNEEKEDAWAKKNAQAFIKTAKEGLKAGQKKTKDHKAKKQEEKAAKKALAASAPIQTKPAVAQTSPARKPQAAGVTSTSPKSAGSPKTAIELARQKIGDETWVCKMDTKSRKVYYFTIDHKKPQWSAPEGWTTPIEPPPGVTLSPPKTGFKSLASNF